MILLDSDDDCPSSLGPALRRRAESSWPELLLVICLAEREFETWFLAAAESLRGHRGLAADLAPPPKPEAIRGTKEWLRGHMPGSRTYSETTDQPALAAVFDIEAAQSCHSFRRFCDRLEAALLEGRRGLGDTESEQG